MITRSPVTLHVQQRASVQPVRLHCEQNDFLLIAPLMWILDSEGDFLRGKRVWLRPGKKYLFGRSKTNEVRHAIQHNSISRKHLVIDIASVKPGDGVHIYARSEISVSDQGSKFGTLLDGEQIKGVSKKLTGEEHTIQLGKYQHVLRIKWHPTVLSFSFSSKELKAKDPLAHVRSRLEDLDVKTIIPYVIDSTTHVVQSKRNTAKGLQALVNGKYIVQESFVDALVYAATPSDLENLESLSPLEADFDAAWPDPMEHLPPPGKEVADRPEESFAPNPDRISIFDGYTFVFGDTTQYENLQDAITNGHGKALFYRIEDGVTTPEDIVQFMRNAAGHKGLGVARNGDGGVVLVRFRSKGQYEDWSIQLSNQVAITTDQRVIEQREFLDAILGNDAAVLCRPLPESKPSQEMDVEPTESTSAPPAPSDDAQIIADSQLAEDVSQASKKGRGGRVRKYVSKMKTFDDGFDINSIPAYAPEVDEGSADSQAQMLVETPSENQSRVVDSFQEEEELVSSLLPGASAMKRRRAETSQRSLDDSTTHLKQEGAARPKRQKLDVLEAARQHREAEEDAARQRRQEEQESLQSSLKDIDVEKLKGLAIVEEMEVSSRDPVVDHSNNTRWDDRWNGRKNFKKFRRKNDTSQPRRRIQTVIVPLEEVTRKGFGIGDHYWVSNHRSSEPTPQEGQPERTISQEESELSQARSLPQSESEKASVSQRQKRVREEQDSDTDDGLRFRFRRRR
ncbi:hypothetical protein ARAM_007219 [Aspergillus rambellii]|uniref:FHA domain-containing protein n=1 Tax=Aspergillus rambellii TaxID=308745 RepID=A0A0F8WCB2_9EURO|nr:hypothetical protein ARAM_007219 [Aspergillus rambellii]